jgi:hypothetical protein
MAEIFDFKCDRHKKQFEAEGMMVEYRDPVFGACARRVAKCPECGNNASEYFKPRPVKVSRFSEPTCGNGSCCCLN